MDLTSWLLRIAAARPHVFLAAVPGDVRTRLAVEAEIGRRAWPLAGSPADADLLVVAGRPGPQLATVIETVWGQMPAPRARVAITTTVDVAAALNEAARRLADPEHQRRDSDPARLASSAAGEHGDGGHDGGDMEMPGGLPMADLGEDRDGLMLDALHVALGPLLPDWPAGLVLRVVLQGDVIHEAEAEVLAGPDDATGFWSEPAQRCARGEPATVDEIARRDAARHLDGLARFLGVAGWADPAARARRLRDALLTDDTVARIVPAVHDLVRRVGRSRTLHWLIRGIPVGDDDVAGRLATLFSSLGVALDALDDPSASERADPAALRRFGIARPAIAPNELASALVGAELAAARLVIAALDPDLDPAAPTQEATSRERD